MSSGLPCPCASPLGLSLPCRAPGHPLQQDLMAKYLAVLWSRVASG